MSMASIYVERLIKRVIELSQSSDWDTAVAEWEIADCEEDDTLSESCVCGKEHLYYLFTIENAINGKWQVVFSEFYTGKDIADIMVNECDLKVHNSVPKDRYPKIKHSSQNSNI